MLSPVTIATKEGYREAECVHRLGDYAVCRYDGNLSIVHVPTGAGLQYLLDAGGNVGILQRRLVPLHTTVPPFDMRTYRNVCPQLRVALGLEEVSP